MEIELERTFLIKELPKDLEKRESNEILDVYIPKTANHPILRIRKAGDVYQITKKAPVKSADSSEQYEKTILLSEGEFNDLALLPGKRLKKIRYYYCWQNNNVKNSRVEIDIYLDDLEGLVTADFEFNSVEEKNNFKMPDFCLAEVTQEEFIAAGWLAGKEYSDIAEFLAKYNYKKIIKI